MTTLSEFPSESRTNTILYRICPGRWLAERLGSLLLASILAVYDVGSIPGETMPNPMTWQDAAIR
jgi:hypothetical protein